MAAPVTSSASTSSIPTCCELSRRHFDYLNASPARLEFVIGDARLSLERELAQRAPQKFDVLAIDAFASDSIPVHLITREAIALYMQHLAPGGVLAVHISNRFLDLKPVLANIGRELGLQVRLVADKPPEPASMSDWILISATPQPFAASELSEAESVEPVPGLSLWTDEFNNLLDVLKTRPVEELKHMFEG